MTEAPSDEVLVEASDLSRSYGPHRAVDKLSLTLRRGEVLGLLGPNGAGKTTTLRMLVGSLTPHAGSVKICGVDVASDPETAKRQLGYLPETPPLHAELAVNEFLAFCARLHGLRGAEADAAVAEARQACGLDGVARQVIGSLSKGYQQRVGLAQAIVHKPALIILDEPTVGLDPIQIREIRALITRLSRSHGVILSSHILPEVQAVCSRVMILAGGREVYAGAAGAAAGETRAMRLVLAEDPGAEAVMALPGVVGAESLGGGAYRLQLEVQPDPRPALSLAAAEHGLLEFSPAGDSLEEIFVRLTRGESMAPDLGTAGTEEAA